MNRSTVWFALFFASLSTVVVGQAPPAPSKPKEATAPKVDWAGLRTLLDAGEYSKARDAAGVILEAVKTDRKAPDFLPKSVDAIDALMRRGFAEFQLGQLDDADASFVAADEVFKGREFQKQLTAWEKKADPKGMDPIINLELRHIEIQHLRSAVVLERMRRAHAFPAAGDADQTKAAENVRVWAEAIRGLVQASLSDRQDLNELFEKGGPGVIGSPHKQVLMTNFHQDLIAGIEAFELSFLPFTLPPTAPSSPPVPAKPPVPAASKPKAEPPPPQVMLDIAGLDRNQLLAKSLAHFDAAAKAFDKAIEKALPKGTATAPTDKRLEAEVLRVQLLLARCAVLIRNRDVAKARKEIDEILKVHKDLASLRKLAKPDTHPDLILPLVLATELALVESQEQFEAGLIDEARLLAAKASQERERAAALPLAADHPRRQDLTRLADALQEHLAKLEASITTTDAAEVAARRIRRAVESTAIEH